MNEWMCVLPSAPQYPTPEEKAEMDARSVYVGNVSLYMRYTMGELCFITLHCVVCVCVCVCRVSILCDKYTGSPIG